MKLCIIRLKRILTQTLVATAAAAAAQLKTGPKC